MNNIFWLEKMSVREGITHNNSLSQQHTLHAIIIRQRILSM